MCVRVLCALNDTSTSQSPPCLIALHCFSFCLTDMSSSKDVLYRLGTLDWTRLLVFEERQAVWFQFIYRLLYLFTLWRLCFDQTTHTGRSGPQQSHIICTICLNVLGSVTRVTSGQVRTFLESFPPQRKSLNSLESNVVVSICLKTTVAHHITLRQNTLNKISCLCKY